MSLNSRMSRLRRSLSRSVHQLNSVIPLSRQSTDLPDLPSYGIECTLADKFACPQNFGQLSELVTKNNDALQEIISILDEKVQLDFSYAKTMHKLAARLQKLSSNASCEIDKAWGAVGEQFTAHATLHSNLGLAFNDDLVQPLRTIYNAQQKTLRSAKTLAERETRKWRDKKEEIVKTKRSLYVSSKELEKIEQLVDANAQMAQKFSLRRKKLTESVIKNESGYLYAALDLEDQRRSAYSSLRKAVENIEAVERQRLAHSQTALGRMQRKMEQLAPNLSQIFERYVNNLDAAVDCDASAYIASLQPASTATHNITLVDYFAENFSEIILGDRRTTALKRISAKLDQELRALYSKASPCNVKGQLTIVEFLEFLYYKINEGVNASEGGPSKGFHRLAPFVQKTKDKQGLSNSQLIIPLDDAVLKDTATALPNFFNDGIDDYDMISDEGCYNSSGTRSTDGITEITSDYQSEHTVRNLQRSATLPSNAACTIQNTSVLETTLYPKLYAASPATPPETLTSDADPLAGAKCQVLYDFTGNSDEELSIKAGDYVIVECRLGNDWLIGKSTNGSPQRGRFPTTYVAFQKDE